MKRRCRRPVFLAVSLAFAGIFGAARRPAIARDTGGTLRIVTPDGADLPEQLAAREVRRYLYLRTGRRVALVSSAEKLPPGGALLVVGSKGRSIVEAAVPSDAALAAAVASLRPQHYLLKTTERDNRQMVLIVGGDPVGTLYGAYRFAEHIGIRFYLHGDVVPNRQVGLRLPKVDERGEPLFETRGIQPFHDFPEGPDWWNTDDYKAILAQLPKLTKKVGVVNGKMRGVVKKCAASRLKRVLRHQKSSRRPGNTV